MKSKVKVLVLRAAGTNCDNETAFGFQKCGARTDLLHINHLIKKEKKISDYQILAIPGGFTYGDDVAAGKILANELKYKLSADFKRFIDAGKLIIGICNGFQVLVKAGLLPGGEGNFKQTVTLSINDSAKFEDRWVYLCNLQTTNSKPQNRCVWTKDLPEIIYLPVAHAEGKFVAQSKEVLDKLQANGQIVFQYCDERGNLRGYPYNPNGSEKNIAGICDEKGRVLGLMPHPERHICFSQHPRWTRKTKASVADGLQIFRNAVEYAKTYL
jgi:phosphoribosylformylglycinamidine synthase